MDKKTTRTKKQDTPHYQRCPAWDVLPAKEEKLLQKRAATYVSFLGQCKTERETLNFLEREARAAGFKPLPAFGTGKRLKPGTRVFWTSKNRLMGLAVIGRHPAASGFRMLAAHHDVPHLDLKALPLYEKHGIALLKTHYYGGVKKFQWTSIPLALHAFIITKAGKTLAFQVGEKPDEPVFTITDIAPHLSYHVQNERKAPDTIKGEELNILVGNRPKPKVGKDDKATDRVKSAILDHLWKTFGIEEEDLAWAEVAAVPAFGPREIGFSRDLIGGFGHDDRVCVMAAFEAIRSVGIPEQTAATLFFDKEEVGSPGASGAQSLAVSDFLGMLCEATSGDAFYPAIRQAISETFVLSADTNAPMDPSFEAAWEAGNSGYLGFGVWVTKFTGARGKSGSSEADVEFVARLRQLFLKENIPYQFGEMGKVDEGGGGTVARFLAELNMHVLDIAIPTLGLHSPFEVISKVDYHYSVSAYQAFLEKKF